MGKMAGRRGRVFLAACVFSSGVGSCGRPAISPAIKTTKTAPSSVFKRWSVGGGSTGLAVSMDRKSVFVSTRKQIVQLNADGIQLNSTPIERSGDILSIARLTPGNGPDFLVTQLWSPDLFAYASDGRRLWSRNFPDGINRV